MKSITVKGTFIGAINNHCRLDIYRPNPDSYDFSKQYRRSFNEVIKDLGAGTSYNLDMTGYTTGKFRLQVSGNIQKPIDKTYDNEFAPGFRIKISEEAQ